MKYLDALEGYQAYAAHYYKDHANLDSFDWEETNSKLSQLIDELLEQNGPEQASFVADLGCGDGRVLARLLASYNPQLKDGSLRLEGWDLSPAMLKIAAHKCQNYIKFRQADFAQSKLIIKPSDGLARGYDLFFAFFVLVHLAEPVQFFEHCFKWLKAGGKVLFNHIPQRKAPILATGGKKFIIEHYDHSLHKVQQDAESAGLHLIESIDTEWSTLLIFQK